MSPRPRMSDRARRRPGRSDRRHARRAGERASTLAALAGVWSIGLVILGFVQIQSEAPVELLLVDPALSSGVPWYAGLVTSLAAIGWTTATVSAAIGGRVCRWVGRRGATTMLRGAALLFALLTLDDVFGFHAWVIPDALGTTKLAPLSVTGALGLAWLWENRRELLRTRVELLAAAFAGFAVSVGTDLLVAGQDTGMRVMIEDGAKFLGVLALAAWSTSTTFDLLRSVITTGRTTTTEPEPAEMISR